MTGRGAVQRDSMRTGPGPPIRNFNNVVYLAANGGSNPWDTATGWPVDTSWLVAAPWAQPPSRTGGRN